MENILFGTTIPNLGGKTLDDLTTNQIGLLLYGNDERAAPDVAGNEVTNTLLLAARGIQFVKKNTDGSFSASLIIPNKTTRSRNYQAYVAGVPGVVKIGDNANASTSITGGLGEEGNIRITNLTAMYSVEDLIANISAVIKPTETIAQYLTRVVALINADPVAKEILTAALETNVGKYQIKLTTKSSKIKLGLALDGLFAPYQPIVVTPRVLAVGTGEQMQEIEKALTVFKGNGNYTEWNQEYYKAPLDSALATNYNTLSLTWTSYAQPTQSATMVVASPNLLVCVPSGDTTLLDIYNTFITPDPVV